MYPQNKAHDGYSLGRVRRQPKGYVEKRITPLPAYLNHDCKRGGLVANATFFLDCNGRYPSDHESQVMEAAGTQWSDHIRPNYAVNF